ncbi:MAG: hypothetical protein H7A46_12415 [Verrucomicrobiales bacterium]|nr:hypothetical protein [Verrucomicrobiales bacterium]
MSHSRKQPETDKEYLVRRLTARKRKRPLPVELAFDLLPALLAIGAWIALSMLIFRLPPDGTHMEVVLLNPQGKLLEPSNELLSKVMILGLLLLLWISCFLFMQAYVLRRSDERWLRICRSFVERFQGNEGGSVQADASPNSRPPCQFPASGEIPSSDSLRTSASGSCG